MENFINITMLNDFIFCPYSIYLHSIYDKSQEEVYYSKFQFKGKRLHDFIDNNKDKKDWKNAFVYSEKYKIYGKIDEYKRNTEELIEYKSKATILFKGYYYQLWSQYLCLKEMGINVKRLFFYDFKEKTKIPVEFPTNKNIDELVLHIKTVQRFDFSLDIPINSNKCNRCIYRNLCDKTIL